MNERNRLGRVLALGVLVGAAYGIHAIVRGGLACPTRHLSCCAMKIHASAP